MSYRKSYFKQEFNNMHKRYLLPFILLFSFSSLQSQICDGNLGENIFTDGDFGSGNFNIPPADPMIAPGYIYTIVPPPDDGFYTLTNDMASWAESFDWVEIQDNSPDPQGYMMIVNASYTPGLFYEKEIDGLCENTLYQFSADVYNLKPVGSNGNMPNISFLLDGVIVYNTGTVPENEQWNTYGFTFTTEPGQTSLVLSLRNNAPGGIGNDIALDNISFRACGPEALILPTEIANICEDGSPIDLEATINGNQYDDPQVQWQQSFDDGATWVDITGATNLVYEHTNLSGGFYYYRYLLANGTLNLMNPKCRVVSNIKIVRVVPKFYTIIDTLCEGLSFSLGDNQYDQSGTYVDSLLTEIGCDSIVTLELTILPDANIQATFEIQNPSCDYLADGSIMLDTILNGTSPYQFFTNDSLSISQGAQSNLGEGEYNYRIIDRFGCSFETSITLTKPLPFVLDMGPNLETELGEPVNISPTANYPIETYVWLPNELALDCPAPCRTLEFTPSASSSIYLTGKSLKGCTASDSVFVNVLKIRKIYIPNVFSPDEDGFNDYFTIFGAVPNIQEVEQLLIYNRWGELVFEKENFAPNVPEEGWDGTFRGKRLDAGVYAYLAKVRFLDGEVLMYGGDVMVVE